MTGIQTNSGGAPVSWVSATGKATEGNPTSTSSDSIDKSSATSPAKQTNAASPELMQALFLLWFTGGVNQTFILQDSTSNGAKTGGIESLKGNDFKLAIQNKLDAICLTILANWSEQVKKDVQARHIEEKSAVYKESEARKGKAGHEAWLQTLSPQQRLQVYEETRVHKELKIEGGIAASLSDYMTLIKTSSDPKVSQDLTYMTAAIAMGGGLHMEYVAMSEVSKASPVLVQSIKEANAALAMGGSLHTEYVAMSEGSKASPMLTPPIREASAAIAIGGSLHMEYVAMSEASKASPVLVQPIKEANDQILAHYTPTMAAELGYLGALMINPTIYFAFGQTLAKAAAPMQEINYEFAKNYAAKILEVVNGAGFNSIAMAFLTHSIEGSEGLSKERIQNLIKSLKVIILSTALALLYKMESSFKGKGGGISGQEFQAMIGGNAKLLDSSLKKDLQMQISTLLTQMPQAEADHLIASISSYIDLASTSKDLINIKGLLNAITLDTPNATIEA